MSAIILDGKATAESIRKEIAHSVEEGCDGQKHRPPGLAVVLVGENPASIKYTQNKERASQEVGFFSVKVDLPNSTTQTDLLGTIRELNNDPNVDGILCQLPLPPQCSAQKVTLTIDPAKDVDGFHPINIGSLVTGAEGFVPCTPLGCQELLHRYGIETNGAHVVILGRSNIVGLPMALLMAQKAEGANSTVTICHSGTKNLPEVCRTADILIAAIGRPQMVKSSWLKEGATVVDVGINSIDDSTKKSGQRLVGDVDYEDVLSKVYAITPVPGGVGPMTIAMLLRNTLTSWQKRLELV